MNFDSRLHGYFKVEFMRIFIIGFKSSGKTTLGKQLARRLKMKFIDLDTVIENMEKTSIPELYEKIGDDAFRKKEWKALKEIVTEDNLVVSTGGGAPCHCDNMTLMEQYGDVLYIKLDDDTLVSRLKLATLNRPIVKNKTDIELREYVRDLKDKCEHHYLRARYIVEGKDLTVDKILKVLDYPFSNRKD
jgi:shikimate kinase